MYVADYRDKSGIYVGDNVELTFVGCQDNMVKELKNIARGAQDMVWIYFTPLLISYYLHCLFMWVVGISFSLYISILMLHCKI